MELNFTQDAVDLGLDQAGSNLDVEATKAEGLERNHKISKLELQFARFFIGPKGLKGDEGPQGQQAENTFRTLDW